METPIVEPFVEPPPAVVDGRPLAVRTFIQVYRAFISHECKLLMTVAFGILSFLPRITGEPDFLETTLTAESLRRGVLWYESGIVMFTLAIPLACDLFFDVWNAVFTAKRAAPNGKKGKDTDSQTTAERILLVLGLFVQPAYGLFARRGPVFVLEWLCCRRAQNLLVFFPVWTSWCRLYPEVFPPLSTSLSILMYGIGNILTLYQVNRQNAPTPPANNMLLYVIAIVTSVPAIANVMIRALIWLCRTSWQYTRRRTETKETFTTSRLVNGRKDSATSDESQERDRDALYFPLMYILAGFIGILLIAFVVAIVGTPDQQTNTGLLITNVS